MHLHGSRDEVQKSGQLRTTFTKLNSKTLFNSSTDVWASCLDKQRLRLYIECGRWKTIEKFRFSKFAHGFSDNKTIGGQL